MKAVLETLAFSSLTSGSGFFFIPSVITIDGFFTLTGELVKFSAFCEVPCRMKALLCLRVPLTLILRDL